MLHSNSATGARNLKQAYALSLKLLPIRTSLLHFLPILFILRKTPKLRLKFGPGCLAA